MHILKDTGNTIFFTEIGIGLIILIAGAACYLALIKHIRTNEENLYKVTKTGFAILISFIFAFMIGYSVVIFSVIFHYHFDFNAIFGPILFLGSIFVLATAYFNVGLFKKLLNSNIELKKQALHDYMTGLPNRRLLMRKISQALVNKHNNNNKGFAVAFIDILNFKRVNDSFGHFVGDEILIQTADRITKTVRNIDTVARLGGDDFVILIENVNPRQTVWFMRNIKKALQAPYTINGVEFSLDISYGICTDKHGDNHPEDLINKANMAMRSSKKRGKNYFSFFVESMLNSAQDLLKFENDFHNGLLNNEFYLVFQPQYALKPELALKGFEALIRWNHPEKGLISPIQFIPLAEETGLILKLDRYVLDNACRIWADWLKKNPSCSSLQISVNISAYHMKIPSFVHFAEQTTTKYNIPTDSLVIELTESAIIADPDLASQKLDALHVLGIQCAIDDFGTGYSSLTYLTKFPTDILKIDKSFIKGIESSASAKQIVKSVIDLAHGLNMVVVAEGVEMKSQLKILEELECDVVQGFYLSMPLSEQDAFDISTK
ncbi:bifunctional diguanylate cyclase/phosphodiesterase [Maridesulfovibrio ferrireducens]|uniref:putative bifunctional diguanylate cyclase/phosphodiesterase n=1 Tax=Maridesulfovibrio ferrireducens TaxID=246191 RepID=UPI001A2E1E49|nr:GGDEF domain-containing phosphodiesterase [Maridesulfovibrio ferrireducens]MBI9111920.1 EAL domain-containing protein [Maridesulfovibrio ferrireducens]